MTSPTSCLNHFPTESLSLNTIPFLLLVLGIAKFFLLNLLLIRTIPGFLSRTRAFLQSHIGSLDDSESQEVKEQLDFGSSNQKKKVEDGYLWRDDAETVMSRLGIFCHPEGDKLRERLGSDDFSNMFEEKEPSLEEVKEAFDVFDANGDGFIDAGELQRVLCNLGFQEGSEMENCRRMIAAFDDSGDGRIDFNEFVKFMENTLSNCSFGKT